MKVTGHLAVGASSYLWAATLMPAHEVFNSGIVIWYVGLLFTMFGSLMPDIDHPSSTFGSKVKIISVPISAVFGHRGITHSALAVAGVGYAGYYFIGDSNQWLSMFIPLICIGYSSHLFADMLCPMGLPLGYPKKKMYRIPIIRNGFMEVVIYVLILSGSIWAYFNYSADAGLSNQITSFRFGK